MGNCPLIESGLFPPVVLESTASGRLRQQRRVPLERARFIDHKGKKIFLLDCSNCLPSDINTLIEICAHQVQCQPEKSVLTLNIAGGGRFDLETINKLKKLTRDNEPYVRKSAVVEVSGLQEVVLMTVARFSKREFHLFNDRETAMDFLVSD